MSLLEGGSAPAGDIWSTGAFSFESPLKDLLDSGSYTLEQLLSEDELLQELRGMHPQLVDFFSQEQAVLGLVEYVCIPPPSRFQHNNSGSPPQQSWTTMLRTEDDTAAFNDPSTTDKDDSPSIIRFPYMACEIICCEIGGIVDTLVECRKGSNPRARPILDLLFSILYTTPPGMLDDRRAGYLDKILSVLFRKRPIAMRVYIDDGGGKGWLTLMKALFSHIYSHSIMQIVQRLLLPPSSATIETSDKQDLDVDNETQECSRPIDGMEGTEERGLLLQCNWTKSSEAIELLVHCLIGSESPLQDSEEADERLLYESQNASEVLITVIQNSLLSSSTLLKLTTDPMLERIVQSAAILQNGMDFGRHDSRLTCAMNVLESLVLQLGGYGTASTTVENDDKLIFEKRDVNVIDTAIVSDEQELASPKTLSSHLPRLLESLSDLLRHPLSSLWVSPVQYSLTTSQRLLGASRLRVVRLLESLVLLGNLDVDVVLCQSDCLEICLDLFWIFEWCSMLHQSVANLLVHVFEGADLRSELQAYFLIRCDLLSRLMGSFQVSVASVINDGSISGIEKMRNGVNPPPNGNLSEAIMAMKHYRTEQPTSSVESERGSIAGSSVSSTSTGDDERSIPPIPCDNVDATSECQNVVVRVPERENLQGVLSTLTENEDHTSLTAAVPASEVGEVGETPMHAFRVGYMGHVVIICQALVHACSDSTDFDGTERGSPATKVAQNGPGTNGSGKASNTVMMPEKTALPTQSDQVDLITDGDVLCTAGRSDHRNIARILQSHPLWLKWTEFISTTLASETAVQSAPLGGINASVGNVDPLHAHRPSVVDGEGFCSEENGELIADAKGLLVGDELIDMDDNDLDIAASMMEALSLPPKVVESTGGKDIGKRSSRTPKDGDEMNASGFGTVIQNSRSSARTYLYDDPLGSNQTGLNYGDSSEEGTEHRESCKDENEEIDEEITASGPSSSETDDDGDEEGVPVIDLFAGNFTFAKEPECSPDAARSNWTNFANFDDAFAKATDCNSSTSHSMQGNQTVDFFQAGDSRVDGVDGVFESSPRALLLADEGVCAAGDTGNTLNELCNTGINDGLACEKKRDED